MALTLTDRKGTLHESFDLGPLKTDQTFQVTSKSNFQNGLIVESTQSGKGSLRHVQNVIRLDGASNFRDFGGYRLSNGSQMPVRQYFRSENLSQLSESDCFELHQLGIRTIFDLRRTQEIASTPNAFHVSQQFEVVNVPISGTIASFEDGLEGIFSGAICEITSDDMAQMYLDILLKFRSELLFVASHLLDRSSGPTLVHCTAGKDRTGLVVALVQLALGVERQDIFYDYLLSNRLRTPWRMKALEPEFKGCALDISRFRPYFSAPYQALDKNFTLLQEIAREELHA